MENRNIKFITSLMLAGVLVASPVLGYKASAKAVSDNVTIASSKQDLSKFKFKNVETNYDEYGDLKVRGTLPSDVDQYKNKLNILRANGDILGIKNFDTMELKEEYRIIYSISYFYQVIDGYRVVSNGIFFQPNTHGKWDKENEASPYISVHFDNDIFDNLEVTKTPENITSQDAIKIAKEESKDLHFTPKAEVVINKFDGEYRKVYQVEIGRDGFYIDTTNGKILEHYSIYIGPQ